MKKLLWVYFFSSFSLFAQEFSVATQNLWHYPIFYKARLERVQKNLHQQADIMAFQEAFDFPKGVSLYRQFEKQVGPTSFLHLTQEGRIIKEGLGIVSKFPLVEKPKVFKLPHDSESRPRTMVLSTFKIKDKILNVINVHFSPFPKNEGKRTDQLNFVIEKIKNLEGPVIILGDFNQDYSNSFFLPLFKAGFDLSDWSLNCTFCRKNRYVPLPKNWKFDYIFYQPSKLELKNVERINRVEPISDHYGLRGRFRYID